MPAFVLAYHGCDAATAESVLAGSAELKPSENKYDWLGNGIYFWEHNAARAFDYAVELHGRSPDKIRKPSAVGAVIDLGYCLNLLDASFLTLLPMAYRLLLDRNQMEGISMPQNVAGGDGDKDMLLRRLDCAVIEALHAYRDQESEPSFDSVRGVFFEGNELYPGAGFREKNHIQICVRNPRRIRAYFRVKEY